MGKYQSEKMNPLKQKQIEDLNKIGFDDLARKIDEKGIRGEREVIQEYKEKLIKWAEENQKDNENEEDLAYDYDCGGDGYAELGIRGIYIYNQALDDLVGELKK